MAALRPLVESVRAASIPTDPAVVAIYILLMGSVWLVWIGNRRSGIPDHGDEPDVIRDDEPEDGTTVEPDSSLAPDTRTERRKLTRAQRRRRGHVDWIQ